MPIDVISEEKIKEARELLDKLYTKMDNDDMLTEEGGMFEVLSWLLDGSDKPELD